MLCESVDRAMGRVRIGGELKELVDVIGDEPLYLRIHLLLGQSFDEFRADLLDLLRELLIDATVLIGNGLLRGQFLVDKPVFILLLQSPHFFLQPLAFGLPLFDLSTQLLQLVLILSIHFLPARPFLHTAHLPFQLRIFPLQILIFLLELSVLTLEHPQLIVKISHRPLIQAQRAELE